MKCPSCGRAPEEHILRAAAVGLVLLCPGDGTGDNPSASNDWNLPWAGNQRRKVYIPPR